jgi:ribosome-binding protein aMBF1 (putative translation factor)
MVSMASHDLVSRVAANLRVLRRRRGLSREVLGANAEVDPQMIKRIESGNANPALVVLSRLAAALAISLSLVVGESAEAATAFDDDRQAAVIESETVGETIRSLRAHKGMSGRKLAQRAQLRAVTLRRYESASVDARILAVEPIAAALGMSTEDFVRTLEQRQRQALVLRGGWHVQAPGVSCRLLAAGARSQVWEVSLGPSASYVDEPQLGAAEEIATAVRGEVRVEIDGNVHRLRRGDSLVLPSEGSRRFSNASRSTARLHRYQVSK